MHDLPEGIISASMYIFTSMQCIPHLVSTDSKLLTGNRRRRADIHKWSQLCTDDKPVRQCKALVPYSTATCYNSVKCVKKRLLKLSKALHLLQLANYSHIACAFNQNANPIEQAQNKFKLVPCVYCTYS